MRAPATDKVIARIPAGQAKDVDRAVDAAERAYNSVWGERCSPRERGRMLMKLADLFEEHADVFASIESMVSSFFFLFFFFSNGPLPPSKHTDLVLATFAG